MFRRIKKKEKYIDYHTGTVDLSQGDVIDTSTTGIPFYDSYLKETEDKNLYDKSDTIGRIIMMSPEEYYEECASKIFHTTVYKLQLSRTTDEEIMLYLHNVLTKHRRKFTLPHIDYAEKTQQGLHRMAVIGDMFGWNYKVPVLVIDEA